MEREASRVMLGVVLVRLKQSELASVMPRLPDNCKAPPDDILQKGNTLRYAAPRTRLKGMGVRGREGGAVPEASYMGSFCLHASRSLQVYKAELKGYKRVFRDEQP